ncbi:MAG TPA: hypothetical protein VJT71_14690 [Pyrinomonadaceae bacterium]|nr:hypothetical protein [Pyrinomonadaceae bacterium]
MVSKLARFVLATVVLVAAVQYLAAQNCNRHVEPVGRFSLCLPDDWIVRERPGDKFKGLFGTRLDDFTPNINFRDETTSMALSDYTAASVRHILASKEKIGATSIELLGQSDFVTDSGVRGIRVVFKSLFKGLELRTIQYFFDDGRGRKLIVTGTNLEKHQEVFDRVFDHAAKSFLVD